MAIIGIPGKKQSGKDTVCRIIQYLMLNKKAIEPWTWQEFLDSFDTIIHFSSIGYDGASGWQRKLFADKLKDIVCMLIGCTREQLEDNVFKETPLGEEWTKYLVFSTTFGLDASSYYATVGEAEERIKWVKEYHPEFVLRTSKLEVRNKKLTPRLLLQLIGTECGRKIIHPNIWVNALMSEYRGRLSDNSAYNWNLLKNGNYISTRPPEYPNWIITDVRFENEVKAIKDRDGLIFRIEREGLVSTDTHESETALDNYDEFDNVIYNRSDIPTLIDTMQQVLKIHNIL